MKAKKVIKILDRLDREINFAGGLAAVIRGLECMNDRDHAGVQELVEVHIKRLKALSADLGALLADA